ncbi:MAG: ribosome-binding factor A [Patescibacteria group bacterium]
MARIDSINKQLSKEIADIVSKEISAEKYMLTITYVSCDHDLSEAKIGISVLPKNYTGSALRELKKNTPEIVSQLKKKLPFIRRIPHMDWEVDKTERKAQELDDVFEEIKKNKD